MEIDATELERLVDRRVAAALRLFADRLKSGTAPTYSLVLRGVADELDPPMPMEPTRLRPFEHEVLFLSAAVIEAINASTWRFDRTVAELMAANGKSFVCCEKQREGERNRRCIDDVCRLVRDPIGFVFVCFRHELRKREAPCDTP